MKKIIFILFATTSLLNCQKKITEDKATKENLNIELIKKHMKLQEKIELSENDTNVSHQYKLTDTDIELGGEVILQGLKNNGYQIPNDELFSKQIKEVFETQEDCSCSSIKQHQNFITYFVNSSQESNIDQTEFDYTYNHIFVYPKFKILSDLPLLNDFAEINGTQLKINLDQYIIARNKFLFNNSKGDLAWLLFNDKDFLKNLLVVFGYDKEEKINEFVLKDLYKEYSEEIPFSNIAKLGKIFFVKDCKGKLKIREDLLKYVSDHTTKDDDRYIYALSSYLNYLFKEDEQKIFNEDLRQKFTLEEKAKIVAYVANVETPAFYKYKPMNSDSAWHNAGTSLYNITGAHPEILEIIKKNNYYRLQPLKEVIENNQFEEEAPILGSDGLGSIEKLKEPVSLAIKSLNLHDRPDFSTFSREILAKEEIEIVHSTKGWDFVKIDGITGYLATEEAMKEKDKLDQKKFSFLAEQESEEKSKKRKGFWDNLFG